MQAKRCLVVGPSWVGDMVMAQSLFMRLKALTPDLHLAVLAPAWSAALLSRMPEVDESIVMPVGHKQLKLGKRWRLARQINNRPQAFDQAIILPGSLKSALIPFFAGIPKRTGFVGEQRYGLLNDVRKLDKTALPYNVQRYLALAENKDAPQASIPVPILISDDKAKTALSKQYALDANRPLLALCPGAEFGPAKQWPAQHFAGLARQKIEEGWQVVLLGSEADKTINAEINALSDNLCKDLSGKTKLTEVIDVLSMADFVVSNDSGLMHIAAALGRKMAAIYGSSSPDFTPPLSKKAKILTLDLSCQPCFKRDCPLEHTNCLQQLLPEQILALM